MAALLAPLKLWRDKALWPALVPLVYGGGIIVFWLQTRDFNYYPPPVIAAAAAYVLAGLNPGWGLVLAAALFVLPPFLPKSGVQQPWMTTKMIRETMMQTDGLEEAAEWLKQTQGSITPDSPEAYGLVTPWDLGNIIAQSSKNPVRWSQTVSPELANLLFTDQPDETYQRITSMKRPLRYLVIPARNLAEKFLGEMLATKLSLNEMLQNGPTVDWNGLKVVLMVPTARSSATLLARLYWGLARDLGHYRLVYESPSQSIHATKLLPESSQLEFVSFPVSDKTMPIFQPLLGQVDKPLETSRGVLVNARLAPEVRIFEAVPGALLTGTAKPTSQVVAKVGIVDPANGSLRVCTYTALANSEGRFELRVPYPTDVAMSPAAGTIKVQGPYEVVIGEQVRQVEVKEEEIKQGKELPL
jgi:hypothetical protein